MKISTIKELLGAEVLCCEENIGRHVYSACGCDLMSDVLAFVKDRAILLTGLMNPQVIRTAEMMDMDCVVFVRGKKPTKEMIDLAADSGMAILATDMRLYEACGKLYVNGLVGNGRQS